MMVMRRSRFRGTEWSNVLKSCLTDILDTRILVRPRLESPPLGFVGATTFFPLLCGLIAVHPGRYNPHFPVNKTPSSSPIHRSRDDFRFPRRRVKSAGQCALPCRTPCFRVQVSATIPTLVT